MQSAAVTWPVQSRPAVPVRRRNWVELALAGGLVPLTFPIAWALRKYFGLELAEYHVSFAMFYLAWVINDPHFAVTYLLFYRRARARLFGDEWSGAQRARYWFAGIVVPAALVGGLTWAIVHGSAPTFGAMFQLMFLLVGWHYAKQGFGILTVLSARRGTRFEPGERRALLAHCYAAWAYAWSHPALPAGLYQEDGVVYSGLAHPHSLELVAGAVLWLTSVWAMVVLGRKWLRERGFALGPLTVFLITIWLLTIYTSADPLVAYMIPALHSIQYLYMVWLVSRNRASHEQQAPSFGRPVLIQLGILAAGSLALGWLLFHGAPEFLNDLWAQDKNVEKSLIGATPFVAASTIFVNIHHYLMDSVIWRRENKDTHYLLKDPQPASEAA